jgi:hypothetical protein
MSHTFRCDNCDIVITEAVSGVGWDFPVEVRGYKVGSRAVFCSPECAIVTLAKSCTRFAPRVILEPSGSGAKPTGEAATGMVG